MHIRRFEEIFIEAFLKILLFSLNFNLKIKNFSMKLALKCVENV